MITEAVKTYSNKPSSLTPHLRPARMEDVPALTSLVDQAVRVLGSKDYTQQQIDSSLKYVFGADNTQLIKDGSYYVVEIENRIAGAGGWSRRKALYGGDQAKTDEDNFLDPAREAAKIRAFYVHPSWARQGIGGRLMQACEAAARAANFRHLEVMATLTGEPLYARFGFKVVERAEIEMPDGVRLPVTKMAKILG